ncbi:MAG: helix-turn-helix domain-containing protein, partial [Lachnospiraceae bacterium]
TKKEPDHQYVSFHYCKEGHIEQETDNEFFYLMSGDCSVAIQDEAVKKFSLPMRHYHGISIHIDTEASCDCLPKFLNNSGITPINVAKSICKGNNLTVLRSSEVLKRIFTDMYEIKEELRNDYLKLKLPEFLFLLNHMESSDFGIIGTRIPRTQVELVKQVSEYIGRNINDRISLKELTIKFGVSATYLQNSFRAVYGMPVISFIRAQKMQSAARLLIYTERSIEDIADELGYINESKFSAVFKKIIGESPSIYRKEHSKIKIR